MPREGQGMDGEIGCTSDRSTAAAGRAAPHRPPSLAPQVRHTSRSPLQQWQHMDRTSVARPIQLSPASPQRDRHFWVKCFFWYRLTQVVPDKGSLNGRVCVFFCLLQNNTQQQQMFNSPLSGTTQLGQYQHPLCLTNLCD